LDGAPEASCPGFTVDVDFEESRLYITEACDGTLVLVDVDLTGSPPVPVPEDRFTVIDLLPIAAPVRANTIGEPRQPGSVAVRPGNHSDLPNVFFLMGEPEGLLCGIEVE
jgi:hypothetical protein